MRGALRRRMAGWGLGFTLALLLMLGLPWDAAAGGPRGAADPATDPASGGETAVVVEHLRVQVPAAARAAWLQAERETWEPWLQRQDGFLRRELLWDGGAEEGILLIHWSSRRQWYAIPQAEIEAVQQQFEAAARRLLGRPAGSGGDNPFPMVFSGELLSVTPSPQPQAQLQLQERP